MTEILMWLNPNSVDVWDQSHYLCYLEFFPGFLWVIRRSLPHKWSLLRVWYGVEGYIPLWYDSKLLSFTILLHLPALLKCTASWEAGECIIQEIKTRFSLDKEDGILTWYGLLHMVSCCTYCTWRTTRVKALPLMQSTIRTLQKIKPLKPNACRRKNFLMIC